MRITGLLAVGAILALSGCNATGVYPAQVGPAWKDADSKGVPLHQGARECKYQATTSSAAATGISKQADVAGDLYESCMRARGY
jgi:hypothetical protein